MFELSRLYLPSLWVWKEWSLMEKFTHVDENNNAVMVDVTDKEVTERTAMAVGKIYMSQDCYQMVMEQKHKKGDVLGVAQVAGIMASKQTSSLIPLCHLINLTSAQVEFYPLHENEKFGFLAQSTIKCVGVTGVEMEALTAVSVALLTIYDMCKAVDKRMNMTDIHLLKKSGGKSGDFNY